MNPFSRKDWKKAAYKQVNTPKGGTGWEVAGMMKIPFNPRGES